MSDAVKKEAEKRLQEIEHHMKRLGSVSGAISAVLGPFGVPFAGLIGGITLWAHNYEYRAYAEELREVIRGERMTLPERPDPPDWGPP